MGRIWRDGQKLPVHIYRLISCGTVEEKILQRQQLKNNLSQNIVDAKSIEASFDNEELKKLFIFDGDEVCITYPPEGNDLPQFTTFSGDFNNSMLRYIRYLKRDHMSKDTSEDKGEIKNEFEKENIFLKHEQEQKEPEDESDPEVDEAEI